MDKDIKNLHEFTNVSGSTTYQKFQTRRDLEFSINDIKMKFTDKFWLGKGISKSAFEVELISGKNIGKRAALMVGYTSKDRDEFDYLMKIADFAGRKNITNKVYTWNYDTVFGPVAVVELITGTDLCKMDINEHQQIQLLEFVLKMSDLGIIQVDVNCGNYIYQDNNKWITIDDLGFYSKVPSSLNNVEINRLRDSILPNEKIYTTIYTVRYIQNLVKKPLKIYCIQWLKENPIENIITKLTIEPKDPTLIDFYDKINTILTTAYEKFSSEKSIMEGGMLTRKTNKHYTRYRHKYKKTIKKRFNI